MKIRWLLFVLGLFLITSCSQKNNIYISASGNDSNDGTKGHPLLTIAKAQELVQTMQKQKPGEPIIVNIRGGVYSLNNAMLFNAMDTDSGKTPVVYRAYKNEEPVFTGSRTLQNWQVLKDENKLSLLDPAVKGEIYVTDLSKAGITDFGDPVVDGNRPDLVCNDQLQTLARWPNSEFTRSGEIRGKTAMPLGYTKERRMQEGIFEYLDDRQDRWAQEKEPCAEGYWYWDWKEEYQKIDKIDPVKNTIYLQEPYHNYGYKDSLRYYGVNLFCEIDQPTEWYLDRSESKLYWYPPEGINPEQAKVTLTVFNALYMVEIKNVKNLTLQGLTFLESRGNGILIKGGENCLIADCRLERFGNEGIHIDGGTGHGIQGCFLNSFGNGGVVLDGGDRRTLTPSGTFVENTVIENFSLFRRTYEPAILVNGCGHRMSHNRFRHSSSSALRVEGNEHVIEYNEISDVVNESDDQGGLDMWYNLSYQGNIIRYNRWTDINGKDGICGSAGVRLDDMISGVLIYGNVFENCGSVIFGAVQVHGGKENTIENNLFYDCYAAYSFTSWTKERWLGHFDRPVTQKRLYEEVDINSPLYQQRYPVLRDINANLNVNTVQNNLVVDCNQEIIRDEDRVNRYKNNTTIQADGKSIKDLCNKDVLKQYGLQPIPLNEMGPHNNKWIK